MTKSDPDEAPDKVQIGVTPTAEKHLDALEESGWFLDRQDAYRLAIAVALARKLLPAASEMQGLRTSYNFAGGIDRDGKLRQLISLFAPGEASRPAAFAERLAHAGLAFLAARLVDQGATLSDVLDPAQMSPWN